MPDNTDWSIFNKKYPLKDGIINALPESLSYETKPDENATHFYDVHRQLRTQFQDKELLKDKETMSQLQKQFYDKMSLGFQKMDDADANSGGRFWWKIHRIVDYDQKLLKGKKLLFIGAGNCRLAKLFAMKGFDVVATDISVEMLKIGKKINDLAGIKMTYVAHNAEIEFPFKPEMFDSVYSLCVMNHIVDWKNYITEKLRCIKKNGIFLERMPNAHLWSFWKTQGELYEGVEVKAKECDPPSAMFILDALKLEGQVWTHDRQTQIEKYIPMHTPRKIRIPISYVIYRLRTGWEDKITRPEIHLEHSISMSRGFSDGIYTMIKITK